MRRRITTAFLATAAAGATITALGFAAAGPASAGTAAKTAGMSHRAFAPSGGPPIYTPECSKASGFQYDSDFFDVHNGGCAGYVGTGRNFRFAQAVIRIPARPFLQQYLQKVGPGGFVPATYIGLSSNDTMALAGVMTCGVYNNLKAHGVLHFHGSQVSPGNYCNKNQGIHPPFNTWLAFGFLITRPNNFLVAHVTALPGIQAGEGIKFSIYQEQNGNQALHFTIDKSYAGHGIESFWYPDLSGAVFTHALALTDFTMSHATVPPSAPFALRLTQFMKGAWTTANGQRGTFSGPWTTQPVSITYPNGEPPPGNTVTVEPSYLWNDGLGNGWGDAFGIWWR